MPGRIPPDPEALAQGLREFQATLGHRPPVDMGPRVRFHWPPEPVAAKHLVTARDFTRQILHRTEAEDFRIEVADTKHGLFGRSLDFFNEARAESEADLIRILEEGWQPALERQRAAAEILGLPRRLQTPLASLSLADLLRLLYCRDRDVAHESQAILESVASPQLLPAMIAILDDRSHPHRRSAQWCVLDMMEDLPSYAPGQAERDKAVKAIADLLNEGSDDFCRTKYKAGVVLGGHIIESLAAELLIDAIFSPSKIARRSAQHAVFHLVEWDPARRAQVVAALRRAAREDPEPLLREFAEGMADDIEMESNDHHPEPVFPDERT